MAINTTPLISVIMATHNPTVDYLQQAVGSILQQTYHHFEFIIIDDGSTADSTDQIRTVAARDSRIRLHHQHIRQGLTKSLNTAISLSNGEYIARMDDDDRARPTRLTHQLSFLIRHHFDLISSNGAIIDAQGRIVRAECVSHMPDDLTRALLWGNFFIHSTFFGTRQVFTERYNEHFYLAQDYEFILRLLAKGYSIGFDQTVVLELRHHFEALSIQHATAQEWFALQARWAAIAHYGLGWRYWPVLLRAVFSLALPMGAKRFLARYQL